MIKKVKLSNDTELEVIEVYGGPVTHNGVSRDSLLFVFPEEVTLTQITELFTPENCQTITITTIDTDRDNRTTEAIHENYTIRMDLGSGYSNYAMGTMVTTDEQSKTNHVRMAQSTLSERMLMNHQNEIDDLIVAVLEG